MAFYCTSYDSIHLVSSSKFHSSDDILNNSSLQENRSPKLYQRVRQWLEKRLAIHSFSHSTSSSFVCSQQQRKSVNLYTATSTEEHSKRRFSTKREDLPDIKVLLQEASSSNRLVNESWADLSCSSLSSPRTSLTGFSPPYKSSEDVLSSSSTPSTPAKFHQLRRSYFRKSVSENTEYHNKKSLRRLLMVRTKWKSDEPHTQDCISPSPTSSYSTAQEKRRTFASSKRREIEIPDDSSVRNILGEWFIPFGELEFKKQIASSDNVQIFSGRWHGNVVVHELKFFDAFKQHINNLLQIRHENILLYMGASIASRENIPTYLIVTNDHGGTSLSNRLRGLPSEVDKINRLDVAKKVASAMGYLHAKGIVHGRLTSKNVFISNNKKVYLSLLDYSVGESNDSARNYYPNNDSIPSKEADIFAFGILVFELFAHPLDFSQDFILSDRLQAELTALTCTDRLKKIIQLCWSQKASERLSFIKMAHLFEPEGCLIRRYSSSEPGLDQIS